MKRFLVLLLIAAIFLLNCAPVATESRVKVVRVIDGDTIEIAGGAHVRYIGYGYP